MCLFTRPSLAWSDSYALENDKRGFLLNLDAQSYSCSTSGLTNLPQQGSYAHYRLDTSDLIIYQDYPFAISSPKSLVRSQTAIIQSSGLLADAYTIVPACPVHKSSNKLNTTINIIWLQLLLLIQFRLMAYRGCLNGFTLRGAISKVAWRWWRL